MDALTLLVLGGIVALGNGLVLWQLNNVKTDLAAHEKECVERSREAAERDRKLHTTLGGLIHAVEGRIPHPSA